MKVLGMLLLLFGVMALTVAAFFAKWCYDNLFRGPAKDTLRIHAQRREHPKCFVSFHREDHDLAQRIADRLVGKGFEAKLVFDPEKLPADLIHEIVDSLVVSAFLIHVNPERRASRWIEAELALAKYWGVRIVPVKDLEAVEEVLPDLLGSYPEIDYCARERHAFEQPIWEMTELLHAFTGPDDRSIELPQLRCIDEEFINDSDSLNSQRAWERGRETLPILTLLAALLAILAFGAGVVSVGVGLFLLAIHLSLLANVWAPFS